MAEMDEHRDWLKAYDEAEERPMPSIVTDTGGGDFKLVSEGVHIAVCDMVVNLGPQETNFGTKNQHFIRWQIPEETIEVDGEEKPMVIGNFYTSSLSEKANLRAHLEAWRGRGFTEDELKGFDLFTILGKACQLSIVHKEKKGGGQRAYIQAVMALPKGTQPPSVNGELLGYDTTDAPDTYGKLPEWLQKKVATQAPDNAPPTPPAEAYEEDGVPF